MATPMRILITGSSGMIGTALGKSLTEKGHDVIGLDIVLPADERPYETIQHDLRLPIGERVAKRMLRSGKIDLITHLAANARVYQLVLDPDRALDNIAMTHRIFEFARTNHVPRLLFASSRETYGNGQPLPVHENSASHRSAESVYTVSKISGEAYCYAYGHCYDIDARIVRYSNVYGRYDTSDRFIPKAILHLLQGRPFTIYGKEKTLDFTYLDDAANGTLHLIENWSDGSPLDHREYNIASGEQSTLFDVAHRLRVLLNSSSEILVGENLVGEVMNYQADIGRMRDLGWTPKTSLHEGLEKSIDYYRTIYG